MHFPPEIFQGWPGIGVMVREGSGRCETIQSSRALHHPRAHPSPSLRRYGWSCPPPGPTCERERIHMDVLLAALGSASAPCSVGDDRGEGDTVDHGGVPLETRDPVLNVSQHLGAAGENGDLAAVFERVRQDVMPGRASGGRSGGSKRWSARDFRVRTGSCAHGGWRH